MYIENLCIEVTRKCNMRCAHCLRGAAQSIDIENDYIDELLRHCDDGIGCLTFTGGEPTLNLESIEHTLQIIRWRNIPLGGFYVVTNGKVYRRRLTEILDGIYPYCYEHELCGLAVSNDEFHQLFQNKKFYSTVDRYHYRDKYLDFEREYFRPREKWVDFNQTRLIDEGRAKSLHGYHKIKETKSSIEDAIHLSYNIICGTLYLNAKGYLIDGCDWSYHSQESRAISHIKKWETFLHTIPDLTDYEQAVY